METRHLIKIVLDGTLRVAQYGQYDGYPSGQGGDLAELLEAYIRINPHGLAGIRDAVRKCEFRSKAEVTEEIGAAGYVSAIDTDTYEQFRSEFPAYCRETSARILDAIMLNFSKGGVLGLVDSHAFELDLTLCEWVYTIDLDRETFMVKDNCAGVVCGFSLSPDSLLSVRNLDTDSSCWGPLLPVYDVVLSHLVSMK